MKVLINGLIGAGNFGDDLISVILVDHLLQDDAIEEIVLVHLSYLDKKAYSDLSKLKFVAAPELSDPKRFFSNSIKWTKNVSSADLIIIGGGGLIQDTHMPFTPWQFCMPALSLNSIRKPAWLVGIGIGPIKYAFNEHYCKKLYSRFEKIIVRDLHSLEFVKDENNVELQPDIVAGSSIEKYCVKNIKKTYLGASIRPWVDLDTVNTANFIAQQALTLGLPCKLFVFENHPMSMEELVEAEELKGLIENLGVNTTIVNYGEVGFKNFIPEMQTVSHAIASRFHANIIWQKLGVPVIPIGYAPKVRSLYEERSKRVFTHDDLNQKSEKIDQDSYQIITIDDKFSLPKMSNENTRLRGFDLYLYLYSFSIAGLNLIRKLFRKLLGNRSKQE